MLTSPTWEMRRSESAHAIRGTGQTLQWQATDTDGCLVHRTAAGRRNVAARNPAGRCDGDRSGRIAVSCLTRRRPLTAVSIDGDTSLVQHWIDNTAHVPTDRHRASRGPACFSPGPSTSAISPGAPHRIRAPVMTTAFPTRTKELPPPKPNCSTSNAYTQALTVVDAANRPTGIKSDRSTDFRCPRADPTAASGPRNPAYRRVPTETGPQRSTSASCPRYEAIHS